MAEVSRHAQEEKPVVSIENLMPLRCIGVGGQAGVWLAKDRRSNFRCAVKQYKKARWKKEVPYLHQSVTSLPH